MESFIVLKLYIYVLICPERKLLRKLKKSLMQKLLLFNFSFSRKNNNSTPAFFCLSSSFFYPQHYFLFFFFFNVLFILRPIKRAVEGLLGDVVQISNTSPSTSFRVFPDPSYLGQDDIWKFHLFQLFSDSIDSFFLA